VNELKRMRGAEHVEYMGEVINAYIILVGKPEGKRPLERPLYRREYNIRFDLKEIGVKLWTRFSWLKIGSSGWLLWTR
jgi:metal-dependent amidase/aminoacylase/carboxypeptidase family protein